MASAENLVVRTQLETRRNKLQELLPHTNGDGVIAALLENVDAAIERLGAGTFGLCESCHDTIEADRLERDPLLRFCLDHMTEKERRDFESDIELAARLQQSLLPPRSLDIGGWKLQRHYEAAGQVSGDYCDVIPSADRHGEFVFLLGDVSGKGVAASLLMAQLHAVFHTLARMGLPLEQMLRHANRVICEGAPSGQYATLICGRAYPDGSIILTNAGHNPALCLRAQGVDRIDSTTLPLGLFHEGDYQARTFTLGPGETLLLYTDGLSESAAPDGEEYGVDRLTRFAAGRVTGSPERLLSSA
jgi:sigma-B regulation protein RsbU (phosphoserine phosphatase)